MSFVLDIKQAASRTIAELFNREIAPEDLSVNETKPEFEGDYTLIIFSLLKVLKAKPQEVGEQIGAYLVEHFSNTFSQYNVIKGFLNLTLTDSKVVGFLQNHYVEDHYGFAKEKKQKVMVEYSSPNTNKPLHFGHLRNIFLGFSYAQILEANGYEVIKSTLVNDRGIHICKSMIAWLHFANGETPETAGMKGDHFVGKYYVKFNEVYKQQVAELVKQGLDESVAEKQAPIQKEASKLLLQWEQEDPEVRALWAKMNGWVYAGFNQTYQRMGVSFDKEYHESDTYLLGKKIVQEGLDEGLFFEKEDHSVWVDLTADGLDEKLLLRPDGTSVYMTQDLGTAQLKYEDYKMGQSIYVIGDEQNYHMKVLKLILQKLNKPYADGIYHLSYGMVELPNGRMKSREGTVVDADDMMEEMTQTAARQTEELGKVDDFGEEELRDLYEILGMGAMKFYLLRVDPKKTMIFDPEESIDFHGFTGPFVQYTYARIQSIFRKQEGSPDDPDIMKEEVLVHPLERQIILKIETFPQVLVDAGEGKNPSIVANYVYELAKNFNSFYRELSVNNAETEMKKSLRLQICKMTGQTIKNSMELLGIKVPDRM